MKHILAFAFLIAGINAFPNIQKTDFHNDRFISDSILSVIQDASLAIKDAGLCPYTVERIRTSYVLPVPILFNLTAEIDEFLFEGLSNIIVNHIDYSVLASRVTFDIELPLIELNADRADLFLTFFGENYTASASGRVAIRSIRVNGFVRVRLGIISGITLRDLSFNFNLGGVQSALNVAVQNRDLSGSLNTFFGTTIPTTLDNFSAEINELIDFYAARIVENVLADL